MPGSLIDTNCLIDLIQPESAWYAWSAAALAGAVDAGAVAINPIIYGELGAGIATIESLEEAFPATIFARLDLPWDAAFLAGQSHRRYRHEGGIRERTLPDFFIGAHAIVSGLTLVTRGHPRPTSLPTAFSAFEIDRAGYAFWGADAGGLMVGHSDSD